MNKEEIQIALILDDNYIIPALVMLYSLKRNNSHARICAHLLKSGGKGAGEIFQCFEDERFRVKVINLQEEAPEFIFDPFFHVSPVAIAKFRLGNILNDLPKVLYLDCDILINGDLSELWETNLGDNYGAFVKDIKPLLKYRQNHLQSLGISNHDAYFNSGVMLLNLGAIRRDRIEEKLFSYRKNGLNNFMDQDAINVVMGGKALQLDLKYNFLAPLMEEFTLDDINRHYGQNLIGTELRNYETFKIIHFSSHIKPWNSSSPFASDLWREYLANFIKKFSERLGTYNKYWNSQIVVSLTSYGKRIKTVYKVIENLKNQSLNYKKLILWLAEEEFAYNLKNLPKELIDLQDDLFEIRFCPDIKSYKKLIPTLKYFSDDIIVTADDDQYYNRHWLLELFLSWLEYPEAIHCHRGHKAVFNFGQLENYNRWNYNHKQSEPSCLLLPTGCGGILYPPNCFMKEVFREEIFINKCATGDDLWFWAMALMNERKFRIIPHTSFQLKTLEGSQDTSLYHENINNNVNNRMIKNIFFLYPFLKKKLLRAYYFKDES